MNSNYTPSTSDTMSDKNSDVMAGEEGSVDWVPWVAAVFGVAAVIGVLFILRWLAQGKRYTSKVRMTGKVVIITGANTGIGKSTALDLATRGAKVYMACRDPSRCEAARLEVVEKSGNPNVINIQLDLSSFASIRKFVQEFLAAEQRLDVLINNAGVYSKTRQVTADGFELHFGVNHLGHFLLTNLLLDILKSSAPSRIVNVSSAGHYMGTIKKEDVNHKQANSGVLTLYCQSKLANVLFTRSLSQRLAGTGVTANSLHPGVVRTELARELSWEMILLYLPSFFYKSPEAGAQTQIRLSVDPELEGVTGKYFDNCQVKKEAAKAMDEEMAEWLWQISEKWTKLNE